MVFIVYYKGNLSPAEQRDHRIGPEQTPVFSAEGWDTLVPLLSFSKGRRTDFLVPFYILANLDPMKTEGNPRIAGSRMPSSVNSPDISHTPQEPTQTQNLPSIQLEPQIGRVTVLTTGPFSLSSVSIAHDSSTSPLHSSPPPNPLITFCYFPRQLLLQRL